MPAARLLLRGALAALREVERQANVVADVLQPGPLGLTKLPAPVRLSAAQLLEEAQRRWEDASRFPTDTRG